MRVLLGLVVLSLIFWVPQTLFGLVGLIPLTTGLLGTCPLYTMLHTGTARLETHSAKTGS